MFDVNDCRDFHLLLLFFFLYIFLLHRISRLNKPITSPNYHIGRLIELCRFSLQRQKHPLFYRTAFFCIYRFLYFLFVCTGLIYFTTWKFDGSEEYFFLLSNKKQNTDNQFIDSIDNLRADDWIIQQRIFFPHRFICRSGFLCGCCCCCCSVSNDVPYYYSLLCLWIKRICVFDWKSFGRSRF